MGSRGQTWEDKIGEGWCLSCDCVEGGVGVGRGRGIMVNTVVSGLAQVEFCCREDEPIMLIPVSNKTFVVDW